MKRMEKSRETEHEGDLIALVIVWIIVSVFTVESSIPIGWIVFAHFILSLSFSIRLIQYLAAREHRFHQETEGKGE